MKDRSPICDDAAEAAVVCASILDEVSWEIARDILRPTDFFIDTHRTIWQAMVDIHEAGEHIDAVAVASYLRGQGKLDRVGGVPGIARLTEAPAIVQVAEHARRVGALSKQRAIMHACQLVVAEGQEIVPDVDAYARRAEHALSGAIESRDQRGAPADLGEVAGEVVDGLKARREQGGMAGAPCRISELNRRMGGWCAELYIVAGRPGMGKSALAWEIAEGCAERNKTLWVFVSLEMPKEDVVKRALSARAAVPLSNVRSGMVTAEQHQALVGASVELSRIPVSIQHTPGASLGDVRTAVRRAERAQRRKFGDDLKLGGVVVDYLQIMSGDPKAGNREQEISGLSRGLKYLSGELGVPVVALSQLNRSVETRSAKDKRPALSDLRESGSIEQDADTIMFVYRDEYYFENSDQKGMAEIIVGKQRNGPTGTVRVKFTEQFVRFTDLVQDDYDFSKEMDPL